MPDRPGTERAISAPVNKNGSLGSAMSQTPPIGGEDPEHSTDFLATQFVFGNGNSSTVGLDVLVTKVAVDFLGLTSEAGDNCVKRNLEALRDTTGVDAICIALF